MPKSDGSDNECAFRLCQSKKIQFPSRIFWQPKARGRARSQRREALYRQRGLGKEFSGSKKETEYFIGYTSAVVLPPAKRRNTHKCSRIRNPGGEGGGLGEEKELPKRA